MEAVALIKTFISFVGAKVAVALNVAAGAQATMAIGSAVIAGTALVAKKAMSLFEVDMSVPDTDRSRQSTVKSATEPQKIIYGEALVSGPISFIGLGGANNSDLYQTIVLAGHKVSAITDVYFDDFIITNTQINSGNTAGGAVNAGAFNAQDGVDIVTINKYLGAASQTADAMFVAQFGNYTSAHRGDGIAYLAMKWVLNEDSSKVWDKYAPGNVKALVKGKEVYDPRLEVANGGTAGASPTNSSYIAYSDNPALCVADYLTDTNAGMKVPSNKIDWAAIIVAADGCDVSVTVPGGTEKRFTCNGVVFATDSHRKNINKILSSMNGTLVYSNGIYVVSAGIYQAPTESLNEDDLIGSISVKTSIDRSERVNTIKGLFLDPAQGHKMVEFPKVQLADALARDNNEVMDKEVQFAMTNSSYMAQRLANKIIQIGDQQKVVTFPANYSALRITAGDRVQVSIEELSWTNKIFICAGWVFSEDGGIALTLREDSSTSYADPAANEYSQVSGTGDITDAFRGVPSPSGLSATAGLKNVELNWVNPARPADFQAVEVYASPNGNFSSAVKIGQTAGTQFVHDASTSADAVTPGNVRFYWVRAITNVGTDAASRSNLEPNADPNTTVTATVGRVNWADVSGSTGAPTDSATVGAQISVNLYDTDGSTVMNQADVKNSVLAQEILQVEVESGEVLDLETGQDVDIQNLGDVAIFVSDSNQTLNSSINTVAQNLSSLEDTVVDLTSGVSDIYIQATAPVAGVGGIPNPIPTFSRWYDSDDQNHPYYWTGSAWVSLKDAQISQNATAITNLQTSLATTNGNVTSNASAISVLDATTVSQGNSITSITSDVTALETTVNNASTGVAANATGLSNLTTRVTTAEGSITTNASDITTLTTNVTTANTNITTNATAISGLDTRVTTAEGTITTQSSDITALESTVNNGTTGVAANASGLSALTTRVSTAEGAITTNSSAVTTLNATYTEDLHFRTEVEDENDDLIDLETSGTVQLQDLSDFVSGSSSAIDSLTVQTYVNEDNIQTQAIQLTALESTVNDPTNGVVATAGALSNLTTEVSVIDGVVTSTAQDLTTLTTTVGGNTASITTQANSINGVEANYSVKIDNNNRITGFGLLSTTAGATPFSEFAVVADQFSIVSPDSTADTPIQPFTVTADKIYFGADVIVSGDLISTGTIAADRLQIDGVMFDTETVGGVTSLIIKESGINTSQIAESAITTARLSNDAVTVEKFANTLQSTNYAQGSAGWKLTTDGTFEAGNGTFRGAITATSGSIANSVTVGGTAASTISAGAIAGASAIQDNDTGLTLGLQAGSAGPITISYTAAAGVNPEVAKLYQGSGTFNNTNTGFYLDNSGNFSLQDKLAFDGSTLSVSGTVNASAGAFTGDVSTDSKFVAGSGATSATMDGADANYKFYAGAASAGDSPFKVDTSGTVTADRIIITRPDDPSAVIFDSAQDGLVGIGLSSISSESDNAVAEIGYELTSNTDNVRLISSSNSNTTLRVLFPLGYAPFSVTSEEDFPDSITLKFQIAAVTGGVVGTFNDISNGSKTFTRRVYSSGAPSNDDYYSVYSSGTAWYVKGKDAVDNQFNLSFSKTFVTNNIDAAYRVQVSFVAGSGSGSGNPNTSASRTIYFTNDTQYFTIDSNDIIRDQAAGSTVTGDVILSGSSGTRSIIWRDSDDLDENWAIEAYVDSSESNSNTMFFKYNNATSTPFSFVGDTGNLLILGDFYSGLGAVTTATASFGGGYGNTGISIDNAGNYQGNGNITIDGTLSQGSDIRLKSNVETIDGSKVFDMRGVSFVKNGEQGAGVIAQELQEIAPELVKEGSDGMLSVAYGDLIGYLIESVKALKDEIDQIKADQS
ncbi:MAG: phage tail tip fiber protein [Alteromonas sp.]